MCDVGVVADTGVAAVDGRFRIELARPIFVCVVQHAHSGVCLANSYYLWGPSKELIELIVEMKRRNPRYGCPRIAEQLAQAFGVDIDKDVVRRVLAKHYRPGPDTGGPSWLTFIGHMKDSLWSVDLFRCESITLKTRWVLVVMDQFTRRIIGFGVQVGDVDGVALCRMFSMAIARMGVPKYLSTDNDPLFTYH